MTDAELKKLEEVAAKGRKLKAAITETKQQLDTCEVGKDHCLAFNHSKKSPGSWCDTTNIIGPDVKECITQFLTKRLAERQAAFEAFNGSVAEQTTETVDQPKETVGQPQGIPELDRFVKALSTGSVEAVPNELSDLAFNFILYRLVLELMKVRSCPAEAARSLIVQHLMAGLRAAQSER